MSLKSDIRETKQYKTFKKIRIGVEDKLNMEKDRAEALSMHAGRVSRRMHGNKMYSPRALIEALTNDMSCRSRLVELRVQASIQIETLQEAIKAFKRFVQTDYSERLNKTYKTVGQRSAFMENMITAAMEVEGQGKSLLKLFDDLIADVDKTSYHLSNMVDVVKLISDKPGKTL